MLRITLVVGLLACNSQIALAASPTKFIFQGQELAADTADLKYPDFRGTKVWLGNREGEAGTAKLIEKDNDRSNIFLNEDLGSEYALGYDVEGEFLPLKATPLADPSVTNLIVEILKERPNASSLLFFKEAEVDMDNDGAVEQIIKANSARESPDPYAGNATAIEGLFLIAQQNGRYRVLDHIIADHSDADKPRTNIDLLAIGRHDSSSSWDLLVKSESKYSGHGSSNFTITINGETETDKKADMVTCSSSLEVSLLGLENGKLTRSEFFFSNTSGFGTACE